MKVYIVITFMLMVLTGCHQPTIVRPAELLVKGNRIIDNPSHAVRQRFRELSEPQAKRGFIRRMSEILAAEENGYSRLVAANLILYVTRADTGDPELLTQEVVDVVAANCVRVSNQVLGHISGVEMDRMHAPEDPIALKSFEEVAIWNRPVDLSFEMDIDWQTMPLRPLGDTPMTLLDPAGWRIARTRIWLNDRLVVDDTAGITGYYLDINHYVSDIQVDDVYQWRVEVEIKAPNGMSSILEKTAGFVVTPPHQ